MSLRKSLTLLALAALLLSGCGQGAAATLGPAATYPPQPSETGVPPPTETEPEPPAATEAAPAATATPEPILEATLAPTPLPEDLAGPLGETYQGLLLLSALNRAAADLAASQNESARLDGLGTLLTYTNTLVTRTPFEPLAVQWQGLLDLCSASAALLAGADGLDQIQGDLSGLADRSEALVAQAELALGDQYGIGADYFAAQRALAQPEFEQIRAAFGF